jgi:hypothetical protein
MSKASSTITIARPINDVFAVLTNVENTGKWYPLNVREWWTSPPPHGLGSTRHAVVTMFGRRSENDAVVTEYDPPCRGVLSGESRGMTFAVAFDFEPTPGGTRVMATSEANGEGLMRLFTGPFIRWYSGTMARGLANAKRMMEAGEL